ncbi:MAG: transcription-repair coupling factor [Candidatus Fluviicola riflensis]|nr:MAG: transcription-repair coupling factor [Candidatus Fluviicola riflensis]OGS78199.1 MAG: transcription-repair coupling factor [Candidatus Fluviicola riflensis]OGS85265.1 MAG: transcription-repair coupling factor [Fluviicola sp. RIFCSPHIGHO2_01_FULL_43_53]OGS87307.1 MAG: transcription-repair coupling factor [Fluviicola sp. RIFCSPHIGHO2_12_FULL_43_24]
MEQTQFKALFKRLSGIDQTANALQEAEVRIHWKGLVGSSKSMAAAAVAEQVPGHHVFVLQDKETAAYFLNDLEQLYPGESQVLFYPASYRAPYQLEETDNANVVARAEVLEKINNGRNCWVITYPQALFERVPTQKRLAENTMRVERNKKYSIDFFNELLMEYGFERVDFVYEPGQFSIRGGIVDIFSFSNDHPFRVEFFGDEVDSIRTFDPVSQLSVSTHTHFSIVPNVQKQLVLNGNGTFLEFIGKHTTMWLASHEMVEKALEKDYEKAVATYDKLNKDTVRHSLPGELYMHPTDWKTQLKQCSTIEFGPDYHFKATSVISFQIQPQPAFNKDFELLKTDLIQRKNQGATNLIFSNQPKQIERLYQIFEDIGGDVEFVPMNIALHEGFIAPELKLVCYTDHQIFERYHRFKLKEGFRQAKQALTLKELYNLQKGDYVTHIDHGVGQFSGLQTIDVNGKQQEAIRLVYRDGDVLYVSIHSLHRISKFTGKEGSAPKMNKLGTQAWATLKQKTKKKIKELAFDLIQLYAKRRSQPGYAFLPDTYLQNELEASFMYEDTPDQLKATQAIKEDMEKPIPMDRLICGDVGFGKTEVAIRAAFKAVADSKQVAVLVPTTILCHQHARSFAERLKQFPCTVDYVNRFKSAKEITETLKRLEKGQIDILIGTHKIVGERVKFKDLGLIIIDEEQKFGVAVKDKLKTLKTTVDTLTLTATPIPRTLQFSLMGARDLSVINTPPPNRQPVLTEVVQFNEEIIRDAIAYEVSRGGQVYFVNNRLSNIKEVAGMISRLCPGVRVGIGHGQMDGKQLEKIMMDFINGEYDVLLATTIIESGIDISNANTILINDAHNFGLSDLHQLRGRVGRSNKKGFCYLIAPSFSLLTSEARKRLEALVQFSDLGSGFNIAMKDLDIRGAGNLLGGEQSGFISEIGFEMYQKILNEAIEELREEEFKDLFEERTTDQLTSYVRDCVLETDFELRIPEDYINNVAERLSIYQELDGLSTTEELEQHKQQLIDRFGPMPRLVKELFHSFEMRWLAQEIGFERLVIKSGTMIGYFVANSQSKYYDSPQFTQVLKYVQQQPKDCKLSEKNDRLRMLYSNIMSMDHAFERLKEIVNFS